MRSEFSYQSRTQTHNTNKMRVCVQCDITHCTATHTIHISTFSNNRKRQINCQYQHFHSRIISSFLTIDKIENEVFLLLFFLSCMTCIAFVFFEIIIDMISPPKHQFMEATFLCSQIFIEEQRAEGSGGWCGEVRSGVFNRWLSGSSIPITRNFFFR